MGSRGKSEDVHGTGWEVCTRGGKLYGSRRTSVEATGKSGEVEGSEGEVTGSQGNLLEVIRNTAEVDRNVWKY